MVQKHNERPHGGLGGLHHDYKTKLTLNVAYVLAPIVNLLLN
jgi:hypothetical protein